MKNKTLMALMVLGAMLSLGLTSCSTTGADVSYPTVEELDALDVQWGLERRKPRGTPTRSYAYDPSSTPSPAPAAPSAPTMPEPRLDLEPAAPAAPSIPDTLR